MVDDGRQDVFLRAESEQPRMKRRSLFDVQKFTGLTANQIQKLIFLVLDRIRGQIRECKRKNRWRRNNLRQFTVHFAERRAQ